MPYRFWSSITAAVLIVACWSAASDTQQTQKPTAPVLDLYGDPLPEGVLGRLGTVRWRHAGNIYGVQFADNDKAIVSNAALGFAVGIWDAANGRLKHKIIGRNVCFNLAVSPNGKFIVTDQLDLIDVKTGQEIHRLAPRPDNMHVFAFSPDSRIVASVEFLVKNPKSTLWDVDTGKELRQIEGHPDNAYVLAFSTDGKTLATGGEHAIHIWDIATGKMTRQFDSTSKQILLVKYSPDGKMLASFDDKGIVRLWDLATGKVTRTFNAQTFSTEKQETYTVSFSPDGKHLASLHSDRKIRLWDLQSGQEIRQWSANNVWHVSFSSDGRTIVSAGGSSIRRWEVATGKEIDATTHHSAKVHSMQFSTDGQTLVSSCLDNVIIEWDLATLQQRRSIFSESSEPNAKYAHWSVLDYSRPANLVAIGNAYSSIRAKEELVPELAVTLWHANTGKLVHALIGHTEQPQRAKFSSDGKYIVSTARDGVRLWEVATAKQVHHCPGSSHCFTPDGKKLIIHGPDKMLRFWDVESKKEALAWNSGNATHNKLCFSSDQRFIASVNYDAMKIWELDSGKEIRRIRYSSSNAPIQAGALSPSGRSAAIVVRDGRQLANGALELAATISLIETTTGDEIRRIIVPSTVLSSLAFSPDGRLLASDGGDSTILFWDMTGHAIPGQLGKFREPPALSAQDLTTHWSELAKDAVKAEKALWALAFSPKQALPFLNEHMKYGPAADAKEVAKIIATLGSDAFADRQSAAQSLEKLGESAEAAVRAHLEGKITLEVRQRLQQFLQNRDKDALRKLRAIEAVEQIGTADARQILQLLAKESPNPRVAESAAAALVRLENRASKK